MRRVRHAMSTGDQWREPMHALGAAKVMLVAGGEGSEPDALNTILLEAENVLEAENGEGDGCRSRGQVPVT